MNRVEQFYQLKQFQELQGLPEKLVEKEEELDESLGNDFRFSVKEYNGREIILGRVNSWYFLGGNKSEFKVFEDKKMILMHLKKEFDKINQGKSEQALVDPSWKGFWAREVESI